MADKPVPTVAVNLPAELVGQFCQSYVKAREMARWESAHKDEINRSYTEDPNDWDDAPFEPA
jgi:hypothetical protein